MVQVLAINSSPLMDKGNTALILDPFLEGMKEAGAEVELVPIDDDLDSEERERLHKALDAGIAAARAGDHVDADEFIGELLARP